MATVTAEQVVGRYNEAMGAGDFATARSLLADDLRFVGPIEEFRSADAYLESLAKLGQIVTGMQPQAVVASGDDVVTIYTLKTTVTDSPVAEWARVKDGKIVEIRVYFDARPFAAMFGGPGG
jgi:ketosteroid isomerase-like protein